MSQDARPLKSWLLVVVLIQLEDGGKIPCLCSRALSHVRLALLAIISVITFCFGTAVGYLITLGQIGESSY